MYDLLLASSSPRRLELLRLVGYEPRVWVTDIPEVLGTSESASDYSRRVALSKAVAGWKLVKNSAQVRVIGADTEVLVDGAVQGKPTDFADAQRMLRAMSGRVHQVLSSVAVVGEGFCEVVSHLSHVEFAPISDAEIDDYVASGEAFGKAGAYAIQGRAACFIRHLEGSHSSVMGLPLYETSQLLRRAGILPK